jgi:proteasome assembly chaperone 3
MATTTSPQSMDIQRTPFPAPSKSSSGHANGVPTTVSSISFADKLLITIAQSGRLAHWVHVPLSSASADPMNPGNMHFSSSDPETALLPRSDLTATTILGGTKREDEVVGQTLVTVIASSMLVKRPSETRLLVVGLGLEGAAEMGKEGFEEVVGLVLDCL